MRAARGLVAVLTNCAVALCVTVGHVELFVSPGGSDTAAGTKQRPLRTMEGARDAVRRRGATGGNSGGVRVWFAGGLYRIHETVVFDLRDSAAPGQNIIFSALPGERPVFSAGMPVRSWKALAGLPEGAPQAARGKLWVAPVPRALRRFHALFDRFGMLPRARTKALRHQRTAQGWTGPDELHTTLPLDADALADLSRAHDAELVVVGHAPWTVNILPIGSVDSRAGVVHLAQKSTYALAQPRFGFPPDAIWVENTFAGLDAPGKWMLDSAARRIYLWPKGDAPGDDIVAPGLIELLRVEGRIDAAGPEDTPVRGLIFRGLTFTHGDRFESAGLTGLGLQHDWERFDASTALVRFRGAEDCAVERCRFENSGGAALRLDLHCQRNRIIANEIAEMGGGGILLAGYGPGAKDVNRDNTVSRNHVYHIGRLWWHSLGIWAWQSGRNRIANNHVHHVPYTAIAITGRISWDPTGRGECSRTVRWNEVAPMSANDPWKTRERFMHGRGNVVERNDIHDVMEVMHDGNGIYISGAGAGNVVRGNFVHDVAGGADTEGVHVGEAIRCDDDQHDTLIEANVVFRFGAYGTGITSKGRNDIVNNIIACPPGRVVRGMISVETDARPSTHNGSRILRNILYATQTGQPFQYRTVLASGTPPKIRSVEMDANMYFNAADPRAGAEYLEWARRYGREIASVDADPLFEDAFNGDFRLKPASPALKLGFKPIDLSKVGPSLPE